MKEPDYTVDQSLYKPFDGYRGFDKEPTYPYTEV